MPYDRVTKFMMQSLEKGDGVRLCNDDVSCNIGRLHDLRSAPVSRLACLPTF